MRGSRSQHTLRRRPPQRRRQGVESLRDEAQRRTLEELVDEISLLIDEHVASAWLGRPIVLWQRDAGGPQAETARNCAVQLEFHRGERIPWRFRVYQHQPRRFFNKRTAAWKSCGLFTSLDELYAKVCEICRERAGIDPPERLDFYGHLHRRLEATLDQRI